MISRERLEELIKGNATVYYKAVRDNSVSSAALPQVCSVNLVDWLTTFGNVFEFYETKEEAEWALKYGDIVHTRRISLPSWDKLMKDLENCRDGDYVIEENNLFCLTYNKDELQSTIELDKSGIKHNWDATKENYANACEMCRQIILEE